MSLARVVVPLLLLGALAPALPARAQTAPAPPAPDAPPRRVDPVVVTATKLETPREQIGAAVSVVTGEDMHTYHHPSVDEALRGLPGVEIRRSGGFGKTSAVAIRGANANQVQVLVDGVRVKSPTLGQLDLSDLAPDLIERIEVIRGPQSTLYGADAIGGVVHVITRRGRGPFSATVHQEVGNRDTLRSVATVSGSWRLLDYAGSVSHRESNGQFENDGSDTNAANLRLGLALPWSSRLDFTLRWTRNDTDLPVKFVCCGPLPVEPIIDSNQQQQSETTIMSLAGQTRPLPWWESRARISRYRNTVGFQDAADLGFPFDFPVFSLISVERREAEWVNALHLGRWSTSTIGLEHRREEGRNRGNTGVFEAASEVHALFVEQQFRVLDRLFLSGGFRVEDHSVFGTETTERGGLSLVIRETGTRLHGSAGSGFRAPTLNDLFFPGFSNPRLQPERSFSWDVGLAQTLWRERLRLDLSYFQNSFDNLIRFVPITTFPFVAAVNIARARAAGIEFSAEADLLPTLVASLTYTYTDSEDLPADRPLVREPRHRWRVGLAWEPLPRLNLWVQVHAVTRQFESETVGYNRGHTRVDLGGTWRLLQRAGRLEALDLTARIQNALDEDYAEVRGFPALGIQALVGLRARF
jgi:vitamin B12 transporter